MNVISGSLPVPLTLMTFFAASTFVRVPEKSSRPDGGQQFNFAS